MHLEHRVGFGWPGWHVCLTTYPRSPGLFLARLLGETCFHCLTGDTDLTARAAVAEEGTYLHQEDSCPTASVTGLGEGHKHSFFSPSLSQQQPQGVLRSSGCGQLDLRPRMAQRHSSHCPVPSVGREDMDTPTLSC